MISRQDNNRQKIGEIIRNILFICLAVGRRIGIRNETYTENERNQIRTGCGCEETVQKLHVAHSGLVPKKG